MRIALALVGLLVLAGCAEQADPPRASLHEEAMVAFADVREEHGPNRTILVLRESGVAERLTYLADGSWIARLAPGVRYSADDLETLFERTSATRERGGLVFRVEHGRVPENATQPLQAYLDGEWPAPFLMPGEPHPWYHPTVLVRAEPFAATEGPDEGLEHYEAEHARLGQLVSAFGEAARAFEPASVEETPALLQQDAGRCLRVSTSATRAAANVGETVEVGLVVTNCGDEATTLDPSDCLGAGPPHVQVTGMLGPRLAALPSSEAPSAAYALDLVCRGDAGPLRLEAGASATLTRRWNGTFAACRAEGGCEYRRAEPSEYGLVAFTSVQDSATPATVTLLDPAASRTRFLLVKQHEWVNSTSREQILGDYGPHCAPVRYNVEPPTLTLWYDETRPALPEAVVVRDWREGARPDNVATISADRLAVVFLENGTAALTSPYDDALALTNVTLDGNAFLVDGTRIDPGGAHAARYVRTHHERGATFEATSILEFLNVGEASVLWARAGGCA